MASTSDFKEQPKHQDNVIHETTSFNEIKELAEQGRQSMRHNGLSRGLSHALNRGESLAEKKSAWPFDYYQCTNLFPVDYKYWERDIQTDCGPSKLITMHASCYTAEGEEFAADQVVHRAAMREAHQRALANFIAKSREMQTAHRQVKTKRDTWGALKLRLLGMGRRN